MNTFKMKYDGFGLRELHLRTEMTSKVRDYFIVSNLLLFEKSNSTSPIAHG